MRHLVVTGIVATDELVEKATNNAVLIPLR